MEKFFITKIKLNNHCYEVYINDTFFGTFRKKTFKELNLSEDMFIENIEELKNVLYKEEYERGKYISMKALGFSAKSTYEIEEKLKQKNISLHSIEKVINFLEEYKLLNDEEYAKYLILQYLSKGKSEKYIKSVLIQKGFNKFILENLSDSFSEDDEKANAINQARKKMKTIKSKDKYEVQHKLKIHLAYKGFSFNVIEFAIREIFTDSNS